MKPMPDDSDLSLRFWSTEGETIDTPDEWTPALVEVQHPDVDWTDAEYFRNGNRQALRQQKLAGEVRTIATWPRSGPGRYHLVLRAGGSRQEVDVTVEPSKITPEEYRELLRDLRERLPAQIAIGVKNAGGLTGIDVGPPEEHTVEQELVRLRRATEGTSRRMGLTDVLRHLAGNPREVLTTEEQWVRRGRARRPVGARLGQAIARPDNLDEGRLKQVPDARSRHTADVYENRLLRQFERQVRLRLRRVERIGPEISSSSVADEAARLQTALDAARRQARFLEEVSELKRPPTRASMTLQKRPLYRAALEGYLELQRSVTARLEAPELDAPLKNLPLLYQLWCTLSVIDGVIREAAALGLQVQRNALLERTNGYLQLRLSGEGARLGGEGLEISIRTERSYTRSSGELRSISYEQRPDIAIEIQRPEGPRSVLLFDPKYQVNEDRALLRLDRTPGDNLHDEIARGGPSKTDIDKMHTYRDAIRGSSGKRAVEYAAILYPGPTQQFSDSLEAICARPGREDALQRRVAAVLRQSVQEKTASVPKPERLKRSRRVGEQAELDFSTGGS
jgi:hypothetical protein